MGSHLNLLAMKGLSGSFIPVPGMTRLTNLFIYLFICKSVIYIQSQKHVYCSSLMYIISTLCMHINIMHTAMFSAWGVFGQQFNPIKTDGGNAGGANCVFPFIYQSVSYGSCITQGETFSKPWCATTSDFDTDRLWGYCVRESKTLSSMVLKQNLLTVKLLY